MCGGVEPPGHEVEAERHRRRFCEELLPIDRVVAFEDRAVRFLGLSAILLDQRERVPSSGRRRAFFSSATVAPGSNSSMSAL